ncbi:TolC family protein [Parvularcula marina]|uniref:TolC family protein n=1 Tax=Parvularcula marina TaxID=2292771 RepID=A0A371RLA4_9PROT|nr:TolC family protein [Parvularcula marina]RFB06227.1 TolC family protein [Parvularcula marina]
MKFVICGALCVLASLSGASAARAGACGQPAGLYVPPIPSNQPLTLDAALGAVRSLSPEAREAALEARASQAEARQAGRWKNPSLIFEAENFEGTGPFSGFNQSETTFAIEQEFELGGQRSKRRRAAAARAALASADCAVILREAELQTALLFEELAVTAALTELAGEAAALSEELSEAVRRRVEAGAAAPPELSRASADHAALKAEHGALKAELASLQYALAAMWGSDEPRFVLPVLSEVGPLTVDGSMRARTHPRILRAEAASEMYRAQQRADRAALYPDVSVTFGIRRFEETGEDALVAGIGMPLPIFDRNRDAVAASGHRADAAEVSRNAELRRLAGEQAASLQRVEMLKARAELLQSEALPAAQSAYTASARGYQAGRFSLTDALDARRALIGTKAAAIEAQGALLAEQFRLGSLLGTAPFNEGGDHVQ